MAITEKDFWDEFIERQGEGVIFQYARLIRNELKVVASKTHVGGHPYTAEGTKAFGYYLRPILPQPVGIGLRTIAIWTTGEIEIEFEYLQATLQLSKEQVQDELYHALSSIPNLNIPVARKRKRPSFPISQFANSAAVDQFIAVLKDYILQVKGG